MLRLTRLVDLVIQLLVGSIASMKTRLAVLFALTAGFVIQSPADTAGHDAFVRYFYAAYKAKDASRMAQFYTPDATFVDPSFELDLKGPDQIRDLFAKVFPKYESLEWQIVHVISAGDDLIVEGTMIGKVSAKTVRVPFVSIFHFRDNKISAQRDMFDVTHFLVQLGAIPPPFDTKPAPDSSPSNSPPTAQKQ